jgi:asparagine N-glycosylation enzyme membrane subunit Stt3
MKQGLRRIDLLLGLALLALATAPRLASLGDARDGGRWILADGDSYYHARRIEQTIARHGRVPMFDAELSYPDGQRLQWHAGYDLLVAGIVAASCGTHPSRSCLLDAAVISTPVLGLLATLVVWLMARAVAGRWPGLLAASLFALYPFAAGSAAIGHIDHHVLEPLMVAAWCWALARQRALLAGLLAGLSFALFPTALLGVLCTAGALAVEPLFLRESARPALSFVGVALLTSIPIVLTGAYPDQLEPAATSWFHPAVLAAVLLVLLAGEAARRLLKARLAPLVAACVASLVVIVAAWRQLRTLLRFVETSDLWTGVVQLQSLASPLATVCLALLLGGACLALAVVAHRRAELGLRRAVLAALPLTLVGLIQIRFLMMASPLLALVVAAGLFELAADLRPRLAGQPARAQALGRALVAACALFAALPLLEYLRHGPPPAARWMRPTIRLLDRLGRTAASRPRGAVLSEWVWGHHVLFLTGLPTVASPFILSGRDPANQEARLALLSSDPEDLYRVMERRGSSYLLLGGDLDREVLAAGVGQSAPDRPAVTDLLGPGAKRWARLQLLDHEGTSRLFLLMSRRNEKSP